MSQMVTTQGSVLHLSNFGEAHRVADVYTADFGRIGVLARHARASKKRFGGMLDIFASLRLFLTRSRQGWVCESVEPIDLRLGLRTNLTAMATAGTFCNCVRAVAAEEQASASMFDALNAGLDACAQHDAHSAAASFVAVARAAGILPPLLCAHCHRDHGAPMGLDGGAFACLPCRPRIRAFNAPTCQALAGGIVVDGQTAQQALDVVLSLTSWHTGKPVGGLRSRL